MATKSRYRSHCTAGSLPGIYECTHCCDLQDLLELLNSHGTEYRVLCNAMLYRVLMDNGLSSTSNVQPTCWPSTPYHPQRCLLVNQATWTRIRRLWNYLEQTEMVPSARPRQTLQQNSPSRMKYLCSFLYQILQCQPGLLTKGEF